MYMIATINRRVFSIKSKKIGSKNTKLVVSNRAEALSATASTKDIPGFENRNTP